MNEKALRTLEYDAILRMLEDCATSPMGRALCHALLPSSDLEEIRTLQQQTGDALSRLLRGTAPSFAGAVDMGGALRRLEVGSALGGAELLRIAQLLESAGRAKAYGRRERSEEEADSLDPLFSSLEPLSPLSAEIRRCLLSESEVADDASSTLRSIRRQMARSSDRIHAQLTSLLNGPLRTSLQDAVITVRNGRYCVPVKAEARAAVPGMVHDQSSTGATLFIEPMAVVKLNNEIRELQLQEEAEIEAILSSLSASAAGNVLLIRHDMETLTQLDFIFARGKLALQMEATCPVLTANGRIHLRQARHPLIEKNKVVPIDVSLGDAFDLLVVTGPNTGGKTVSLKTVGLCCLMAQSGLHIPCLDRSELPVFTEIYADIGDEQSIEQSLSTFSAHMTNIVSFLEKADPTCLVLFDELGAGTDPVEGAALAISILSYLRDKGVRTMATTHYSELKVYALSTDRVENASCEFDVRTLRPTYRLLIGVPGKSNAFAISERLGIPHHIIEKARAQMDSRDVSLEDVMARLEEDRVSLEEREQRVFATEKDISHREANLADRERQLEAKRQKALDRANEEAQLILQQAKETADRTLRAFRKAGADPDILGDLDRQRAALREHLRQTQGPALVAGEAKSSAKKDRALRPGDAVRVLSMNLNGIVRSVPDARGNVFVQMGVLRSKIALTDLERIDEPEVTGPQIDKSSSGKIKMSKSFSVRPEINLLGKSVDDAVAELDKYLDDAYLAHLESVRVVHGKGTGALRKGIHQYLRRQPHVKHFALAEYGEGDAGVTIVTFKA